MTKKRSKQDSFDDPFQNIMGADVPEDIASTNDLLAMFNGNIPEKTIRRIESVTGKSLVVRDDGGLQSGNVILSSVGITNIADLTEDELVNFGELLFQIDDAVQWWMGDWLNRIPKEWGQTIEAVAQRTGKAVNTLYDYQQVANLCSINVRSSGLTFSHHRVILYDAKPTEIYEWLHWIKIAENNGDRLSIAGLKRLIKGDTEPKALPVSNVVARLHTETQRWNALAEAVEAGKKADALTHAKELSAYLKEFIAALSAE